MPGRKTDPWSYLWVGFGGTEAQRFVRDLGLNSLGISPKDFLTEFRISRGKEQLALTDLSVEEIAVSCGYRNSLAFGKVFKQKVGMMPTKYRNDNRKDTFFVRYTCINKHKEQVHRFNCKRGNI